MSYHPGPANEVPNALFWTLVIFLYMNYLL